MAGCSRPAARWGLDAKHRNQHQALTDDAYTWQFALDRLVLGHATGSEADVVGVAPWIELEGGALEALDRLLRLLRVLAIYQRRLGELLTAKRNGGNGCCRCWMRCCRLRPARPTASVPWNACASC